MSALAQVFFKEETARYHRKFRPQREGDHAQKDISEQWRIAAAISRLVPVKRTGFKIVLVRNHLSYCIWCADKPARRICLLIHELFVRGVTGVDGRRFHVIDANGDNWSRADVGTPPSAFTTPELEADVKLGALHADLSGLKR
ncbi:hypothetical protein GHK65_08040 [Sinorhizobium meliloti]|uniref:hypothetical protein n=1 Tax=Rhizobium meliloti TaxID=382 RepID=UPI001295EED2|nr:hypothetical protein [Sinorhizobium meliloti]MQV20293.1 hypothetical protein [Sinorhizobium meliloti]